MKNSQPNSANLNRLHSPAYMKKIFLNCATKEECAQLFFWNSKEKVFHLTWQFKDTANLTCNFNMNSKF